MKAFIKSAIENFMWIVKCLCHIPLFIAFPFFLALIDFLKEQQAKKDLEEQRRRLGIEG